MNPLVSIVLITYNHEKYISQCIESILEQSFTRFELIIVNDGSTDKTHNIIQQHKDPRIIYHSQANSGPSSATNTGISIARTEYIALISGDDLVYKDRIQYQYSYFLNHPNTTILFGRCEIINENGGPNPNHPLKNLFNSIDNTDQYTLFRRLFFQGNCLNAVTCMLRKSFFIEKTKGFQYSSLQLQDFMMWLEWLKHSNIILLDKKLSYYRVRNNNENLSSPKNDNRTSFEHSTILEKILDDIDMEFFRKCFEKDLRSKELLDHTSFEVEKAFIYLKHDHVNIQKIGLKKLFYLMQDSNTRKTLLKVYNFSLKDYFNLTELNRVNSYANFENAYHSIRAEYPSIHHDMARFFPFIVFYHRIKEKLKLTIGKYRKIIVQK